MPRAAKTTDRGYGANHQAMRRRVGAIVDAGQAACVRCGLPITAGAAWDLGHHDWDRTQWTGPEHRRCNRRAGAQKGNLLRARRRSAVTQLRW